MERKRNRRRIIKSLGAGFGATTLAGCQTGGNGNDNGDNNDNRGRNTPGDVPDDLLSGETIRLGGIFPEPDGFPVGRDMLLSAKLAEEHLNDRGGILGADVELLDRDSKASAAGAKEKYQELVYDHDVDMTFGYYLENAFLNTFKEMSQTEVLNFGTATSSVKAPQIVSDRYDEFKYYFQPPPDFIDLADAMVEFFNNFASDFGWESLTLLVEDISLYDTFYEVLDEGMPDTVDNVVRSSRYSASITDWTPLFNEFEEETDVAVVITALTGGAAVSQWVNQQREFSLGGIIVPLMDYYAWESYDGRIEGSWTANYATPHVNTTPTTAEYVQAFEDQFNRVVSSYAAPTTYDSLMLYAKAIEQTGSTETEDLLPYIRDELVYEESTFMDYIEFNGADADRAHKCKWTNQEEMKTPLIQQWQQGEDYGRMEALAPDSVKTAEYESPPWM